MWTQRIIKTKKTRFRFSEAERIKCLKGLFNILCEEEIKSEEELWRSLHLILCRDNPRFKNCSLRLLKDHTLEQIVKYEKYDSEEATERGKERLLTEWGDTIRLLLTVWSNYEQIISLDAQKKTNKMGRPKKITNIQQNTDTAIANAIPEAIPQTMETNANNLNYESYDIAAYTDDNDNDDSNLNCNILTGSIETNINDVIERSDDETIVIKNHPIKAEDSRNSKTWKDNGAFLYLSEKLKIENDYKRKELLFREKQHADNIKQQQEEIAYKRAKLEFEQRKWMQQVEERKMESQRNNTLIKLLENVLMAGNCNKNM